jgi:trehalose 6-phosphate phosphatase
MASRYFFEAVRSWDDFSGIRNGAKVGLFLDFDGTLVPIQKDPSQCTLPAPVKKQLRLLAASDRFYVTILSGRSLADVRKRVGLAGLYYGGNHGLEIFGPDLRFTHPKAVSARRLIGQMKALLEKEICPIEGAWLEDKKFSLTLHFRSVERKEDIASVKKIFYSVAADFLEGDLLSVIKGKKVLELAPYTSWNKGSAVIWLMKKFAGGALPVFVGDDLTDETAFRALGSGGISVRIGRSAKTSARYYLKRQPEISQLLTLPCVASTAERPGR